MHIFIKTGLDNHKKYVPHLVEHCCVRSKDMNADDFFQYYYDTEAAVYSTHTEFTIPDFWDLDTFLDFICKPIDPEIIKKEKKVIAEELDETADDHSLFEKTGKKLYGKDFCTTRAHKIQDKELLAFHQKHYRKENMIICKDNYKATSISNNKPINNTKRQFQKKTLSFVLEGYKQYLIYSNYSSRKDYFFLAFIEFLLNAFLMYEFTLQQNRYYYDTEALLWYPDYIALYIPDMEGYEIKKDFFESYKSNFLKSLKDNYFQRKIVINSLLLGEKINKSEIIGFIKKLTYEEVISVL